MIVASIGRINSKHSKTVAVSVEGQTFSDNRQTEEDSLPTLTRLVVSAESQEEQVQQPPPPSDPSVSDSSESLLTLNQQTEDMLTTNEGDKLLDGEEQMDTREDNETIDVKMVNGGDTLDEPPPGFLDDQLDTEGKISFYFLSTSF